MNQANEGNNPDAPPNIPVKRKRGRPRKDQSLNRAESARVPPGFEGLNGNQPRHVDPIDDANDGVVGQAVTGVVEAAFDAGYLLTVRIGNSNTCLRGVVFKPGHYVPISTENDVAPHVQMIRRNEIHLPTEHQTRVRGHHPRSRERNEQHVNLRGNGTAFLLNGSPSANQLHRLAPRTANLMALKGKHVPSVVAPAVPPVGARGTVVPVILQPVNLSNGLPPANQVPPVASPAAHLVPSKGKQMQMVASQGPSMQSQTNFQVTPKSLQNENGPFHQGTLEVLGEEAKSIKLAGVLTPDEINERVQVSSQSSETYIENSKTASKSSMEDSGLYPGGIGNMNEPLLIKPLQAIRSDVHNQCAPVPKPLENNRTGRMSELLQALQENMTENQVSQVEHVAADELSPETDVGDEETVQSKKCSRASSV
uniref:AT hook motif-containing protein n=1 Tax=Davidia involucrata TaxID=16924 RepID=A0A5B6YTY0_DAVIN